MLLLQQLQFLSATLLCPRCLLRALSGEGNTEAVLEPQLGQELLVLQLLVLLQAHSFEDQMPLLRRCQGPVVLHSLLLIFGRLLCLYLRHFLFKCLRRNRGADVRKVLVVLHRLLPVVCEADIPLLLRAIQLSMVIHIP